MILFEGFVFCHPHTNHQQPANDDTAGIRRSPVAHPQDDDGRLAGARHQQQSEHAQQAVPRAHQPHARPVQDVHASPARPGVFHDYTILDGQPFF